MRILAIGDVIGSPGRKAVAAVLPGLRKENGIGLVIANVENLAAGFGASEGTLQELKDVGVDVFTSGNHIWSKKEVEACWAKFPTLLRPANYPKGVSGRGACVVDVAGESVAVLNLMGRTFFANPIDDPFAKADELLQEFSAKGIKHLLVDFHAEASSEKVAMSRHLDGRVSALWGTHTHVPTADARVLPGGTAYITDLGLTGGYGGVIGMQTKDAMPRFLKGLPTRFEPEESAREFWGLIVEVEDATGRAKSVEQVRRPLA